jgi:DNA-binding MarR family transcriptional regulator
MHLIQLARQKGAITPSAAAEEMACDRPTLTLIAEKCLAQGWLAKKRHTRDRRSYRLELTGEGEELLDRIERSKRLSGLALGDPLDVLGPDEREFFRSCLVKIEARAKELYRL